MVLRLKLGLGTNIKNQYSIIRFTYSNILEYSFQFFEYIGIFVLLIRIYWNIRFTYSNILKYSFAESKIRIRNQVKSNPGKITLQFLLLSLCFQNYMREKVKINNSLHNKNYIEGKGLKDQAMKHVRKHETDDSDFI